MASPSPAHSRVNLRTPEVMERVQAEVQSHYRSALVEEIRAHGGTLKVGETTFCLAKQFGFCYGVERAIDLAYAARKVFPDQRIFLLGEIIHNPDVNAQIASMGIHYLAAHPSDIDIKDLQPDDVIIVPAFGAEVLTIESVKARGCYIVDTTCGDVMSVWKRVRQNAHENVTSLIHGKSTHEETRATASRALGEGNGHYLVVLDLEDTNRVCDYIRHGGDRQAFLHHFEGAYSPGFDPDIHLHKVGVANQTTMLRSETEEVQRLVRAAIQERDGGGDSRNFRFFDTICGATQDRQDALFELLNSPLDLLLVIGGYNSSNTTHLAEIGEKKVQTYFIRNAECLHSTKEIACYNLHTKQEVIAQNWLPTSPLCIGITAGASCPNNLIEDVIRRLLMLRGTSYSF